MDLYEKALNAILDLFNDTSITKIKTIENLNSLIGEIEIMIQSLGEEEEDESF